MLVVEAYSEFSQEEEVGHCKNPVGAVNMKNLGSRRKNCTLKMNMNLNQAFCSFKRNYKKIKTVSTKNRDPVIGISPYCDVLYDQTSQKLSLNSVTKIKGFHLILKDWKVLLCLQPTEKIWT